jgi:lysophospholipase L1-like esterase
MVAPRRSGHYNEEQPQLHKEIHTMRRVSVFPSLGLLVLTAASLPAAEPEGFFLHKGDRVVFLGDSITEQYQYSNYIELYLTTRFPSWQMTFLNAGIGGDTATGGAHRFQSHVLDEKPTAVTIDFGMNDGGYGKFNPGPAANYVKQTEAMLGAAKKAGVRVALMSPNAVQVRGHQNLKTYLETQQEFYAPLKDLAAKYEVPFVDQYAVTRKVLEKLDADPATVQPFPDGVHTGPAGGLLMAHTILVGLKAPAVVSDVTIDAPGGKAKGSHCTVKDLTVGAHGVTFERTDEAIPIPVQPDWRGLLPFIGQLKDFNYYGLKVTGLDQGKYGLTIDGKVVGTFTAAELAEGVNLGNLPSGPLFDQGQKVLAAINAKNQLVHQRFRGVVMFQAPDWLADVAAERKPAELKKRMEQIDARQAEIYKLAQPEPHRFELKLAK